jgi:5'-nucleotidase / UDP-sugar diphosphatase
MRRYRRLCPALLLAAIACARPTVAPVPRASAPGGSVAVTILHFNDVYEITPVEGGRAGGLARVATIRQDLLRRRAPLLTTLGGDFLSPSALGTARLDGQPLAGRQMVAVLNAVGLDWTTLGNHEFDIAEPLFRARVAESRFRYVVSNVTDSTGHAFPGIMPHAVVRMPVAGRTIRLGLIGLVTAANRVPWVRYEEPAIAARREVEALQDSVDAIVALTHLSVAEDQALVTAVPAIDLVLGGHEHENYLLRRGPHFTPIIKADANVRTVAVVTLAWPPGTRRPDVTSELLTVTDSIPADPAVDAVVSRWMDTAFAGYARDGFAPRDVVATVAQPLDGRESTVRSHAGTLTDVVLAAMRHEAVDAELAVFNGGSIRIDDVVPPGPVTQYDVIRILPFGGTLVRVDLTGAVLARLLQQGRDNAGTGGYLHVDAATLAATGWQVAGAPIDAGRRYRVVVPDFLLTGREVALPWFTRTAGGVTVIRELRDVRMALIDELRRGLSPATPR